MKYYPGNKEWKQKKYNHILEVSFRMFAENGIEQVTMTELAEASDVGRMTLFRYFPSKTELVVAISTCKWKEFIEWHNSLLSAEEMEKLTGAEYLKFFIDSFLELYRSHKDILRFNYNFNSFVSAFIIALIAFTIASYKGTNGLFSGSEKFRTFPLKFDENERAMPSGLPSIH